MNSADLVVSLLVALVVLALAIKFWRLLFGAALIGCVVVALLSFDGRDCGVRPGDRPAHVEPPMLQTRFESVPAMDGGLAGIDQVTGYQRWESVPVQKVTGTVMNVGGATAHATKLRIVFCSANGQVISTGEATADTLSPGQSGDFEYAAARPPQLRKTKVVAYSDELAAPSVSCW